MLISIPELQHVVSREHRVADDYQIKVMGSRGKLRDRVTNSGNEPKAKLIEEPKKMAGLRTTNAKLVGCSLKDLGKASKLALK